MTPIDPQDYLAFHTVSEFASVALACLVFWIAWHGGPDRRRGGLRWLGGCLFGAALLDAAHALSYEGMPRFVTASGAEKAIAFWFVARLVMALGLLGATMVGDRRLAQRHERATFIAVILAFDAVVLGVVLTQADALPHTYLAREGLTPFKRAFEWGLIALLAWAGVRFVRRLRTAGEGGSDPAQALRMLAAACAMAALTEWCFTRYAATTDAFAVAGHLLKLAAYFLIYRAVVLATVRLPLAHLNELATALSSAANAVSVTDAAGVVRWANDACARMTGLALPALVGRPLAALGQPDGAAAFALPRPGSSWQGRLHGRRADGAEYVEQRTVTPIASEFGSVVGYVSVGEDVTERIAQQERYDELQRRLAQAQKMEALGQLTGGVAHDFNNILAGVLGLSRLALERYVDDPQGKLAQYLQEIVKVSERGRDLVAKMMAFSRPEALPPAEPMELGPPVQEVVRLLRMQMPAGVALQVEVDAAVPPVRLGLTELHQLLANLVLNARDAVAGQGRIDVRLSFGPADAHACSSCGAALAPGEWVCLRVRDDGEGMAPEQLARIFEPFYTTKQVGRGSGLGLPMVQGVVHGCNGHIAVRSGPGEGTAMELLLPPAREPAAEPAQGEAHAQAVSCRPLRVWVVDDDPVVALYLREALALQGHEVQAFEDPASALAGFMAQPAEPDVVITDHAMPGLPGDELARRLLAVRPGLPVILCTGNSDGLDEQRALDAGIRQVLHKPFEARELVQALRNCQDA